MMRFGTLLLIAPRLSAGRLIADSAADGPASSAEILDQAEATTTSWSPGKSYSFPIPAYMIAPQKLFDSTVEKFKELGLDPIRVNPHNFFKETAPCEPSYLGARKKMKWAELGVWESHRDAWKAIAKSGRTSLVLEADWTIGNQSAAVLRQDFRETIFKMAVGDVDLMWAGKCGSYCATAYFIKPHAAETIAPASMCDEHAQVDVYINRECGRKPFRPHKPMRTKEGSVYQHRLACVKSKVYPVEYFPGLYGDGPIYQDRRLKGMHADTGHWKTDHKFIAADMPHDTY